MSLSCQCAQIRIRAEGIGSKHSSFFPKLYKAFAQQKATVCDGLIASVHSEAMSNAVSGELLYVTISDLRTPPGDLTADADLSVNLSIELGVKSGWDFLRIRSPPGLIGTSQLVMPAPVSVAAAAAICRRVDRTTMSGVNATWRLLDPYAVRAASIFAYLMPWLQSGRMSKIKRGRLSLYGKV